MDIHFIKRKDGDKIWWSHSLTQKGKIIFTFDKKKIFNLYKDYPDNLTKEQLEIFNKENPELAEFMR